MRSKRVKYTLANRYDVFTYHISTSVPNDATAFTITDTLVPVLEFSGDIAVEIDGKLISANTTIDNQTLTVDLTEEQVRNNGGKPVVVTFNAKIRSGANLSAYIVDGKTAVPNTAEYVINNNPETKKKSNEVPVYPPTPEGGEPEIDKKINKTLDYLEIARGKSYNYDITTTIPEDIVDYKEFVITDQVDSALQINGDVVVDIDASAAILGQVSIDKATNHVVFDITNPDVLASLRGRQVTMSIYATINPEADLSNYVTDKGIELIPNTASVTFDRNPQTKKKTNTVTVTPPPLPEPPVPPGPPLPPLPPVEPPVPSDPPTQPTPPTPPTPPTTPPAESTPPTPGKTLPKTGVAENGMYALVGMILGTLTLVFRRRKQ